VQDTLLHKAKCLKHHKKRTTGNNGARDQLLTASLGIGGKEKVRKFNRCGWLLYRVWYELRNSAVSTATACMSIPQQTLGFAYPAAQDNQQTQTGATSGPLASSSQPQSRQAAEEARKDRTLAEFMLMLDDYEPLVYISIQQLGNINSALLG
jgi:hypothetical protein